jgi:hypothetical protein
MSVVRQLAQAVLLVRRGCAARLVATSISNCTQRQDATVDNHLIWVRDQRGGEVLQATSAGTPRSLSRSPSASTPRPARRDGDLLLLRRPATTPTAYPTTRAAPRSGHALFHHPPIHLR